MGDPAQIHGPNWPLLGPSGSSHSKPSGAVDRPTLYTGVSNRSRGWKSRRRGESTEGSMPHSLNIKRWDGAKRACVRWDSLKRDAELWYKNGNCLVHLYRKGQSRRGPSFKVPFRALLAAKCHPLIERYVVWDANERPPANMRPESLELWSLRNPMTRVELYIPPPRKVNLEEGVRYHLAVRNFLAWIFRRSVVGEHLGTALIGLFESMQAFRCSGEANEEDLIEYMDEEGYLDMRNQPVHALAVLHLAEHFELRDPYIDAFVHCAGMNDQLFQVPEYQLVSSVTRKLMRRAKIEMDLKLGRAGVVLQNFLEDDLSEAHIGLTLGGRAHLERFRCFLLAFFNARLGYYPPDSMDSGSLIFEPYVYRLMCHDFKALYEYLVDTRFTTSENASMSAQGGICTLQVVHSFDVRNRLTPLPYPLPRLPELSKPAKSRRMSWLTKPDKLNPDRRLLTHAALVKATNHTDPTIMNNELVIAYRRFEEDSICTPMKADRGEKISQADARKIRWILVYGIYQILKSCNDAPPQCQDTNGTNYNTSINTANLPPWREGRTPGRRGDAGTSSATSLQSTGSLTPNVPASSPSHTTPAFVLEPDIDYLALSRQQSVERKSRNSRGSSVGPPVRLNSLQGSLRRSLSVFSRKQGHSSDSETDSVKRERRLSFHEIVVHGYGNGTNDVKVGGPEAPKGKETSFGGDSALLANRSHSTSSTSSSASASSANSSGAQSAASSVSTAPSLPRIPSAAEKATPAAEKAREEWPLRGRPDIPPRRTSAAVPRSGRSVASSVYSRHDTEDESRGRRRDESAPPAVPRRNSLRRRQSLMAPTPLRVRKEMVSPLIDPAMWALAENEARRSHGGEAANEAIREGEKEHWYDAQQYVQEVQDIMDQFMGVGGLTEPTHESSKKRWTMY